LEISRADFETQTAPGFKLSVLKSLQIDKERLLAQYSHKNDVILSAMV